MLCEGDCLFVSHLPFPPPCCSGLGGCSYWLLIFPVDCIKSAMQTDSIVKSERKYKDFLSTAKVKHSIPFPFYSDE